MGGKYGKIQVFDVRTRMRRDTSSGNARAASFHTSAQAGMQLATIIAPLFSTPQGELHAAMLRTILTILGETFCNWFS